MKEMEKKTLAQKINILTSRKEYENPRISPEGYGSFIPNEESLESLTEQAQAFKDRASRLNDKESIPFLLESLFLHLRMNSPPNRPDLPTYLNTMKLVIKLFEEIISKIKKFGLLDQLPALEWGLFNIKLIKLLSETELFLKAKDTAYYQYILHVLDELNVLYAQKITTAIEIVKINEIEEESSMKQSKIYPTEKREMGYKDLNTGSLNSNDYSSDFEVLPDEAVRAIEVEKDSSMALEDTSTLFRTMLDLEDGIHQSRTTSRIHLEDQSNLEPSSSKIRYSEYTNLSSSPKYPFTGYSSSHQSGTANFDRLNSCGIALENIDDSWENESTGKNVLSNEPSWNIDSVSEGIPPIEHAHNKYDTKTNSMIPGHNKYMDKATPKILKYDRIDKARSALKTSLKKSIKNYSADPKEIDEMGKICEDLNRITRKQTRNTNERESIDRFEQYFKGLSIEPKVLSPIKDTKTTSNTKTKAYETTHEEGAVAAQYPNLLNSFVYKYEDYNETAKEEPLEIKMPEIIELLKNNQIVLVKGDTGCGKTTQIPRILMDHYNSIVCTQPRRLAAVNVARKVAKDFDCKLGTTIGYSIRFEDVTSKQTRLKFATDGILLKEIGSSRKQNKKSEIDQKIAGYDLIVIDEAHERTINIDFLLGYIKNLLKNTMISTKILIMSANLNTEKFIDYFNCPVIEINHKSHKIDHFYLNSPSSEYLGLCIQTTISIVHRNPLGDILVFLTGQEDIEKAYYALSSHLSGSDIRILKLFSSMPADEQDLIFEKGSRKIILSTNVAETSVTIENVKFVVDSGKVKTKRRSVETATDFLEIVNISKAQAKQRAGRAGRTHPGCVYRMYTYEEYLEMVDDPVPEILRSNLSSVILSMKSLGIDDIYNFDFIDKLPNDSITVAIQFLYYLKAIDSRESITKLGYELSKIPLDPEIAMSLYAANKIGCLNAVATIAAFLDYQTPFLDLRSDHPKYKQYKSARSEFTHPRGNFYTFLCIYEAWIRSDFSYSFLRKKFLNTKTMNQIRNVRAQLLKFFPEKNDSNLNIEQAFCSGFFMNVAKKVERGYRTIFGDNECYLHPSDGLFKSNSKYVLFFQILCIKKEYMNHCLEIEAKTLKEAVNKMLSAHE